MRKALIVWFLILMVCGLVSSAYAERKLFGETLIQSLGGVSGKTDNSMANTLKKNAEKTAVNPEKIKIEHLGSALGREIKILDSKGMPVTITDEKGKPVNLIVGSKGNLVVQKLMAVEKAGVKDRRIKQEIIKLEKPTIARPAKPQKPEFTKPQPITNFR